MAQLHGPLFITSTVLSCVPLSLTLARDHLKLCDAFCRHAMLALACLAEVLHHRACTARPSSRPSLISCGCLRSSKKSGHSMPPAGLQGLGHSHGSFPLLALWWVTVSAMATMPPCTKPVASSAFFSTGYVHKELEALARHRWHVPETMGQTFER